MSSSQKATYGGRKLLRRNNLLPMAERPYYPFSKRYPTTWRRVKFYRSDSWLPNRDQGTIQASSSLEPSILPCSAGVSRIGVPQCSIRILRRPTAPDFSSMLTKWHFFNLSNLGHTILNSSFARRGFIPEADAGGEAWKTILLGTIGGRSCSERKEQGCPKANSLSF